MAIYMRLQNNNKVIEMHHLVKSILGKMDLLKSTPSVISDFLELQTIQD